MKQRSTTLMGLRRALTIDRGDGPVATIIGAAVFFLIVLGSFGFAANASQSTAIQAVNTERKSALQTVASNFKLTDWNSVIDLSARGVEKITSAPTAAQCAAPLKPASCESSNPFAYYSRVTAIDNTNSAISTPGGVTNSDGSMLIELIAPKLNEKMASCTKFPTQSKPDVSSKCIYIKAVRSPLFADAAAVPDWRGLRSTSMTQVSGSEKVTGPQSKTIATINTCEMQVESVRVSFNWTPDEGSTLTPITVSHILTDGRTIETLAAITSGRSFIGDFNRGTKSVCGDNDQLSVTWSGAGSGTMSALLITPIAKETAVGQRVPGPIPAVKLQADATGKYSIAWDAPTKNTVYPPIRYEVQSQCNTEPVPVPIGLGDPTKTYSGGANLLPLTAGETIEQHIDRCPVYRVTPVGAEGPGPIKTFTLSSIDAEYTGVTAAHSATTNKITVDFAQMPSYIRNRINTMTAYYCFMRSDKTDGCDQAPILDLRLATNAGAIPNYKTATNYVFDAPDKSIVRDGKLVIQLVTDNARQATKSGSNTITLTVQ